MAIGRTTNIIIAGVGGQGNRTLMKLIAHAALAADEEVRVLSSTSLGRLSGPITGHIRIGPAASATIPTGEADILVALEMNEALRALPMMRHGALAFIHTYRRVPIIAGINGVQYPSVDKIEEAGTAKGITSIFLPQPLSSFTLQYPPTDRREESLTLPPTSLDTDNSNTRTPNTFQTEVPLQLPSFALGVLCGYTRLLPRSLVEQALCQCFPHVAAKNIHTLAIGWQYGEKLRK